MLLIDFYNEISLRHGTMLMCLVYPGMLRSLQQPALTLGNQQKLAHIRCTRNAGGSNLNRKVLFSPTLNDIVTDETVAFPSLP